MDYYLLADTHFRHKLMLEIRGTDYEERIYRNLDTLQHKLKEDAVLIHLGDVAIGSADHEAEEHDKFIVATNGFAKRVLVLGNHDTRSIGWYITKGWDWVCHSFELDYGGYNIVFTHVPLQRELVKREINIHGHLHNVAHRAGEYQITSRHYLVSPELTSYSPESLKSILKQIKV